MLILYQIEINITKKQIKPIQKKIRKKKKVSVQEFTKSSSEIFNNRELGWLNFNLRVLFEAADTKNPMLERMKFLSISSSNLDEFFMKRIGGLKRQIAYGLSPKSSDGHPPKKQLAMIAKIMPQMLETQSQLVKNIILELSVNDFKIIHFHQLKSLEKKFIRNYFLSQIFPILTPLSVDPGHPFPFISNLSTSLGVSLAQFSSQNKSSDDEKIFARVQNQTHRPLLHETDPRAKIHALLAAREPAYRQADVLLNSEFRSIREVAQQVVNQFRSANPTRK